MTGLNLKPRATNLHQPRNFLLKRIFSWLVIGVTVCAFAGALAICVDGLRDHITDTDLAIVPGNTVNADGTLSWRLQGRLDAALDLYRAGHCKTILVSGGIGAEGWDEAEVMKRYLIEHGVQKDHVYTDSHGSNTFETARFAAALIRSKGLRNPMLVSQFFHISRLRLALRKHGVDSAGNVHSLRFEVRDFYSVAREVLGYVEYVFKTRSGAFPTHSLNQPVTYAWL